MGRRASQPQRRPSRVGIPAALCSAGARRLRGADPDMASHARTVERGQTALLCGCDPYLVRLESRQVRAGEGVADHGDERPGATRRRLPRRGDRLRAHHQSREHSLRFHPDTGRGDPPAGHDHRRPLGHGHRDRHRPARGSAATSALLPRVAAVAQRLTGRAVRLPPIPARPIWFAALGTTAAWLLYGLAFALLARAVLPGVRGSLVDAVAIYTISYLAGYLFVPAPGGLGVREWTMVQGLTTLGLASQGDAWVIAFASRLWLTVLEVLPGVLFIFFGGLRSPPVHLHVDHT